MKNALLVLAVLLAFALGVFVFRQHAQLSAQQDEIARLLQDLAKMKEAAQAAPAAEAPKTAAKRTAARDLSADDLAAFAEAGAPAPAPAVVADKPGAKEPRFADLMKGITAMMTNDAMKAMIREQSKMQLDMRYGRLFKFLDLSPEKQEALKSLLMDRQMAFMDGGLSFMDGKTSPEDRKKMAQDLDAKKKAYDAQIKDLIGAEDFDALQQFEQTEPERMQVDMLKTSLAGSGEPLTEKQEYDLVNAMHSARTNAASPLLKNPDQMPDPAQFTDKAMADAMQQMNSVESQYTAAATGILSANQMTQFKKFNEQQRQMREIGMKFAAQMFGGGSNAVPAGVNVQSISVTPGP